MTDDVDGTVKIRRNEKVGTDDRGRSVWTKPIKEVELELVSTVMLEGIIHAADDEEKKRMLELANGEHGYLARDTERNEFDVVRDDELEAALQEAGTAYSSGKPGQLTLERVGETDPDEELSLVSTQQLRVMLQDDDDEESEPEAGWDPYDSG